MNSYNRTASQSLRDWLTANLTQLLTLESVCITTRHTLIDNSYFDVDTITKSNQGTVNLLTRIDGIYREDLILDNLGIDNVAYLEVIGVKEVDND